MICFSSTDTASPEKGGPDRSVSDPDVSPIKGNHNKSSQRSRSQSAEEREDEGDSGIAVIETSQTIATVSGLSCQRPCFLFCMIFFLRAMFALRCDHCRWSCIYTCWFVLWVFKRLNNVLIVGMVWLSKLAFMIYQ